MKPYFQNDRTTLYHAKAEEVYPVLEPGFTLAILDGPYGVSIADWDRMGVDGLADWYRPHLEQVTRLMAPSASLYLWNTAEGWARLDPMIRSMGWKFEALVTWLKTNPPSQKGTEALRCWPDFTEVCGVYQREELCPLGGPAQFISYAAGASEGNTIRKWLYSERARAGLTGDQLEEAVNEVGGKGNMICRHSFTESQWCLPTWEQWKALHQAWNQSGNPEGRPYLQRDQSRVYDLANPTDHDALRADHDALRAEYDALRCPFTMPVGIGNVWTHQLVPVTSRLICDDGSYHPTEKPLLFADRIIRASSRPSDRILVPFGGTSREAVANQRLEEPRHVTSIEMNRLYLDAVRGCFELDTTPKHPTQQGLFK